MEKKPSKKKNVGTYLEDWVTTEIDKAAKDGHRSRCAQIAMVLEGWAETRKGENHGKEKNSNMAQL